MVDAFGLGRCILPPVVAYMTFVTTLWRHYSGPWVPISRYFMEFRYYHNVLFALYSFLVAVHSATKINARFDEGGYYAVTCRSSPGSPPFWYASKYWEWFDTFFMMVGGRRPSILHLFHHGTTAPLVALNLFGRTDPTPLFDVGTYLNGLVHSAMYLYYAEPIALMAIKKWITLAQIVQHALVVGNLFAALLTEACDAPYDVYGISLLVYAAYLGLFLRFYLSAYF